MRRCETTVCSQIIDLKHSKELSVREILHVGSTENMHKSGEGTLPCIEDLAPATARYLRLLDEQLGSPC
jgi:hypothetical protein